VAPRASATELHAYALIDSEVGVSDQSNTTTPEIRVDCEAKKRASLATDSSLKSFCRELVRENVREATMAVAANIAWVAGLRCTRRVREAQG
jgi:hypothetical protein